MSEEQRDSGEKPASPSSLVEVEVPAHQAPRTCSNESVMGGGGEEGIANLDRKALKELKKRQKAERQGRSKKAQAVENNTINTTTTNSGIDPSEEDQGFDPNSSRKEDSRSKQQQRRQQQAPSASVQLSKALSYILRHGAIKEGLRMRSDGFVTLNQVLERPRVKSLNMAEEKEEELVVAQEGEGKGGKAKRRRRPPTLQDVVQVVEANEKKRFEMVRSEEGESGEGVWLIRAVQGHSIKEVTDLSHVQLTKSNLELLLCVPDGELKDEEKGGKGEEDVKGGGEEEGLSDRLARTDLEPSSSSCRTATSPTKSGRQEGPVLVLHGTTAEAWQEILSTGGLKTMKRNHVHLAKGKLGDKGVISGMRASSSRLIFVDIVQAMTDGIEFFLSSNGVVLTPGIPLSGDGLQGAVDTVGGEAVREGGGDETRESATKSSTEDARGGSKGKYRSDGKGSKGARTRTGDGADGGGGILPIKYFVKVEDKKGNIVWRREGLETHE
ncbi:hypothetical protein IE53DRAFT_377053 [Violaceomyces palustris]|uniref:Uncharacterized protein n=1 Tax=Violaceomyces palustris TaxID=1673888 RepID=A0ACD0P6Z1_9BASI|nr:hypothetical protein IE53DRAFT_377053 [Violaceomyces palustris]